MLSQVSLTSCCTPEETTAVCGGDRQAPESGVMRKREKKRELGNVSSDKGVRKGGSEWFEIFIR